MSQEVHAWHSMEDSLARRILALLRADDFVVIVFTAEGWQSDSGDYCAEHARGHSLQVMLLLAASGSLDASFLLNCAISEHTTNIDNAMLNSCIL